MPRFLFKVPLRGGRDPDKLNRVNIYKSGTTKGVVYDAATKEKASKLALKAHGAIIFIGELDEYNQIKPENKEEPSNEKNITTDVITNSPAVK